jgi:hypothetical protein
MTARSSWALSAMMALGLFGAAVPYSFAQEPPGRREPTPLGLGSSPVLADSASIHQQLADTIARQLQESGQLRHYQIDVRVEDGVVDLTGTVSDPSQREIVLRIVRSSPGVTNVRDRLTIQTPLRLTQANTADRPALQEPGPLLRKEGDVPLGPNQRPPEPTPIFQAGPPGMHGGMPGGGMQQPPPLPPYAWPTYAAYNNYSRVGYPTLYPPQSFPFIGPMHPFPKVPLGWRAINLEYLDGHWWYGRHSTGHDFWRVRYW